MLISISRGFEDYDFATYNGKRTLNISAGSRSLTIKPDDVFGYRDGRSAVYVITPVRGFMLEYKVSEDDFDKRIAPRADELKPAKAKKLFARQEEKSEEDVERSRVRTGTRKKVVVAPPTTKPKVPEKAVEKPTQHDTAQDVEEHALVKAFGNPVRFKRIKTLGDAIGYIAEVWTKVNNLKCEGQLQRPTFALFKDMGEKARGLGRWSPRRRALEVSPRLFKAKEHVALTTIVHEIAHEAVSDIEKMLPEGNGGHGPVWSKWMHKFGLTPSRYSQFDKLEYFDDAEKAEIKKKRDAVVKLAEEMQSERNASSQPRISPAPNKLAQIYSPNEKKWLKGLIACPNDKAGKNWAFVTLDGQLNNFKIVPNAWFHALPVTEFTEDQNNQLKAKAQKVAEYVLLKMARRSAGRTRFY